MSSESPQELIGAFKDAGGVIFAVSENRHWIEVFFEGDLMHTKTIDLPTGAAFDIYVEEIPHKTTVYEHPRIMIFFTGACDLAIRQDGHRVIISGSRENSENIV